jgi:hypothetical protein
MFTSARSNLLYKLAMASDMAIGLVLLTSSVGFLQSLIIGLSIDKLNSSGEIC